VKIGEGKMSIEQIKIFLNGLEIKIIDSAIKLGLYQKEEREKLLNRFKEHVEIIDFFSDNSLNHQPKDSFTDNDYRVYAFYRRGGIYINADVFCNKSVNEEFIKENLLEYFAYELFHALNDIGYEIGIDRSGYNEKKEYIYNNVGSNAGAAQRMAQMVKTDILNKPLQTQLKQSLGVNLNTDLNEYQIEDYLNQLFCKAQNIPYIDFLASINQDSREDWNQMISNFNYNYGNYEDFKKSLDKIYILQSVSWEKGDISEEITKEALDHIKDAQFIILQCAFFRICSDKQDEQAYQELLEFIKQFIGDKQPYLNFINKYYNEKLFHVNASGMIISQRIQGITQEEIEDEIIKKLVWSNSENFNQYFSSLLNLSVVCIFDTPNESDKYDDSSFDDTKIMIVELNNNFYKIEVKYTHSADVKGFQIKSSKNLEVITKEEVLAQMKLENVLSEQSLKLARELDPNYYVLVQKAQQLEEEKSINEEVVSINSDIRLFIETLTEGIEQEDKKPKR